MDIPGISPIRVARTRRTDRVSSTPGAHHPPKRRREAERQPGDGDRRGPPQGGTERHRARTREGPGARGKGCTRWWPAIGARPARDWCRYGGRVVRHDPVVGGHQTGPEGLGGCGRPVTRGFVISGPRRAPAASGGEDGPRALAAQRPPRRSPRARAPRSSGCVTPRQRLVVDSTSNARAARRRPRRARRGRRARAAAPRRPRRRPSAARHRVGGARPTSPASNPHRFIETSVASSSTSGSTAVVDVERAVDGARRRAARRSTTSAPSATSQTPRVTGRSPTSARSSRKPTRQFVPCGARGAARAPTSASAP